MTKIPSRTVEILPSCHALLFVDNKLIPSLDISAPGVGDPPEKVALKGIDWSYKSDEKAILKRQCFRSNAKKIGFIKVVACRLHNGALVDVTRLKRSIVQLQTINLSPRFSISSFPSSLIRPNRRSKRSKRFRPPFLFCFLRSKFPYISSKPQIMVRGRDACWEHCVLVDATRQKVRCNYCRREFSGGVYRMKFHLAQIKNKDIVPCAEVPDDVRDHIQSILSTPKKQKTPKKPKMDKTVANGQQNSSSGSGGLHPNQGSSGQHGSTCPSLLFPRPSPSEQPAVDDASKQKQDDADKKIAVFFFHNSIPFGAAKSICYQEMVDAIAECGVGYKAPNKILEDISKQDWVCIVLEEAKRIARYIYSDAWILNMMRKFTGGRELMRPRITRFVENYLTLRSIVIQEDNLKHAFSHSEWTSSIYSRRSDAQAIKSLVYLERFWKSAREAVSVTESLVKILRIVDGDMPAMGYIYEGIERAKAAFLNPSIFYNPNFKIDLRMRNGFQEAMLKMATTEKDKIEITKEHPVYINAQGALGTDFAIMGRTLNAPGDWWASYGYEVPTLQRVAIRILSQPCSFHWCKWNWSTFETIHTKKRNKPELEKLNDLVFVHCNLWLQTICESRDGKCKPIIFDDTDVSLEWPTELEPSVPLLDDSWLDNLPFE
ncbi:hypothetical protein V6N13_046367 [Hibiscus sabdariffa]